MHEFYLIYLYAIPVLINQHVSLGTYGYVSHFKVEGAWNIFNSYYTVCSVYCCFRAPPEDGTHLLERRSSVNLYFLFSKQSLP